MGLHHRLPVAARLAGRHLARADRQHLRHPPDRAAGGADRRRRGDLPRGIRQRAAASRALIELNITNLAAVPSIIYGLLGLGLFVRMMGMGRSVLAGAATLALLVLPVVILSTREALRAVPEVDPRRVVRARRHQVADDLVPGAAGGAAGHPDRPDPRAVARDRRDGAADHDRRGDVRDVRARQHLVAVHRAADSDLQLGVAAAGRVPRQRRRRHPRAAGAAADDERGRDLAARSLSEERRRDERRHRPDTSGHSASCVSEREPPRRPTRAVQDRSARHELLLRRQARAPGHLGPDPPERRHRVHRAVGLRQEHVPAHAQPDERHHSGDPRRRARC